jgi:hypothetical protein
VRPTRILAVIVSAVLGIGAGVAAALLMDRGEHGVDPLGAGVPLANQSCTGKFLLVTAWGTSGDSLGPGISADPDHAHYLTVESSCPTAWRPRGTRSTGYISYLGPYDDARQACAERVQHRGAFVTRLRDGNQQGVQCLCSLSPDSMPEFTPGMVVDAEDGIYMRALQDLLTDMSLVPPDHRFIGRYDPLTVRAIKQIQETASLPQDGVVDTHTWDLVIHQGCQNLTD